MKTEIPSFPLSSSSVAPRFGVSGVGCYCGWRGDVWFLCVPKGLVASHHLACGLVFNDGHGVVECVRMLRFHLDSTDSTTVSCQAVRCSLCDFIYAKELPGTPQCPIFLGNFWKVAVFHATFKEKTKKHATSHKMIHFAAMTFPKVA